MTTRRERLVLLALVVLAAIPRLLLLGDVPPGLHPDEAVNAYEGWCLFETGGGSDGRAWPLVFQMHGRFWVEGTYVWLVAACQALPISLTVATRLPAALAGILLVPVTWVLARRLLTPWVAWAAAGLIALEPMAWHYAHLGLRASLVPLFLGLGLALLLAPPGASRRLRVLRGVGAGLALALALWTYTPMRLLIPFIGLAGVLIVRDRVKREPVAYVIAGSLVTMTLLASLPWTFSPAGQARFEAVSVFANSETPFAALGAIAKGYASQFAPRLLFWGSSSRGFWAEGVSPLLAIEAPLILIGIGSLVWRVRRGVGTYGPRRAAFVLAWLVLAPLPAALTTGGANPLRAIGGLPVWSLLGAEGLRCSLALARRFAGRRARKALLPGVAIAVALCAAWSGYAYFVRFPRVEHRSWFAGQTAAIETVLERADEAQADVTFECHWVEASLVRLAGRRWRPRVIEGEPTRVVLTQDRGQRWTARLGPTHVDVYTAAGDLVLRVACTP